nr:DNA-binding response regulator [uncultured Actinoplanes sp.]
MLVRIAVSDPLPLFRRGVMAALADAGVAAEAPDDLLAWVRTDERRIVLLTTRTPEDWTLLADVCGARNGTIVLAVVEEPSVTVHLQALTAGAVGVLARDTSPEQLREALTVVARGSSILPIAVVRTLAAQAGTAPPDDAGTAPTAEEIGWLRALAGGSSVATVADRAGYSERMMFRLLRQLYARMGAASRTEALMRARAAGLI